MISAELDRLLWRIPSSIPQHAQTRIVETSNSFLRIRDSGGTNPALVFLCDPPVTIEAYDELIACFQPGYRVIIIELPSFGFSRVSSASALSFDGAVQATEEVIGSLNLEAFVLFGPCICGFVAAELVKRAQLQIKGLVLLQTPDREGMLSWVERMDPKGLLRVPILGQLVFRFTARRMSKFWLSYATAKEFDSKELVNSSDCVLKKGGGFPLASMLQLWSVTLQDAKLEIPAVIVWGKKDRSHKHTLSSTTCKHVSNAAILELAECGHFTELEQPVKFSSSVLPFIEQCLGGVVSSQR